MSTAENPNPAANPDRAAGPMVLKRLAIWGAFLGIVYLARDFFFVAFMTFMISYLALSLVQWGMAWLGPRWDRPGVRRLMTIGVFVFIPLVLLGIGAIVIPQLVAQGQKLAGWLSQASPETEASRLLEGYVGPSEFRREYGNPDDPRYPVGPRGIPPDGQGPRGRVPRLPKIGIVGGRWIRSAVRRRRAWPHPRPLDRRGHVEQGIRGLVQDAKSPHTGPEGRGGRPGETPGPGPPQSASAGGPAGRMDRLRRGRGVKAAKQSPVYRDKFRPYYEEQRAQSPDSVPYTFDQFIELQAARPKGPVAFGAALEQIRRPPRQIAPPAPGPISRPPRRTSYSKRGGAAALRPVHPPPGGIRRQRGRHVSAGGHSVLLAQRAG